MCEFRQIPFAVYGTKEELGHHIGKAGSCFPGGDK